MTLADQALPPQTGGDSWEALRTFSGPALREIAFPLGGIGTGTVALGGRGELRDWEIFNRPAKGRSLPFTFFALWMQEEGRPPLARVLERQLLPPYVDGAGIPPGQVAGLPRLREATFQGCYPFAWLEFQDDRLPLRVTLEAFNPFIPLDAEGSGLPVAIFRWRLHNPGPRPVAATLAYSQLNPVGYDGVALLRGGRRHPGFGGNLNIWRAEAGLRGIAMSRPGFDGAAPGAGSLAVATTWPDVTYALHWERAGWFDDLQSYWDGFRTEGRLPDDPRSDPTPEGETDVGTLGLRATLAPGATVELPVILAWHFPNLTNYWNREPGLHGKRLGNFYSTRFADAWQAALVTAAELERLESSSRRYITALLESTLPAPVLDAVSSQASIIRTTTCLRTEDGRFHAFEGCNDNAGCCPMDCTHVWNYEQSLAFLFPELERSMRLTDYGANTLPDGEQKFRTLLPLAPGALWQHPPAADGQMGTVVKLYREWQFSGDEDFLRRLWPAAKASLEYAWQQWDADRDGLMEGEQHNTYDIEFYGPNSMCGTLYLAALRAGARMARHLGDDAAAQEYERVFASGRERLDRDLWNGEFFIQRIAAPPAKLRPGEEIPRYQYGPGCLADQLLGQWLACVVGLGDLLPPEHVRSALAAIVRYNWRPHLDEHESCQRTYALNDEAGLVLCTWPHGGRPRYPFPYSDEVWTGFEYQVAAHLIYEGMLDDGLAIVAGARARHDGLRRNPWDEFECGHHYARAMSSWSLLTALSGYRYSAPERRLGFLPRLHCDDFRCFFSTGSAWGLYRQQRSAGRQESSIAVLWGELALRRLELPPISGAAQVTVRGPGGAIGATVQGDKVLLAIELEREVIVREAEEITVSLAARAETPGSAPAG